MKKSLLIFVAILLFTTTTYANFIPVKNNKTINELQLKITVKLGDVTNLTESEINNKIKLSTAGILTTSNYDKYTIVIEGSMAMEQLDNFSFSFDIKGNLAEVKKELKTIAKILIDWRNQE